MPRILETHDLFRDAELARVARMPVLLAVTQTHCGHCQLLKREVLDPMVLSGDYADRALLRELVLDRSGPLRDFDGVSRPVAEIAGRYRARLTPTVLLLSPDGAMLVDAIVGVNTLEMYSYYLDEAIAQALGKLRR